MLFKIILSVCSLCFLFACGIKGPPLPPISEETIQKQKASEIVSSDSSKANIINNKTQNKKK